jgi:hemoglobin
MPSPAITESSIIQLVDTFYARVRDDAVLSPVFEAKLAGRWHEHMPRMYAFWTKVLLGTGEFQGNVFGKHMALSAASSKEHFVRWLTLFRLTAIEVFGVDGATARRWLVANRIASSLQLGFFRRYPRLCRLVRRGVTRHVFPRRQPAAPASAAGR